MMIRQPCTYLVFGMFWSCVLIGVADASHGGNTSNRWLLGASGAYSPTSHGGDSDGATFPGLAVTPVVGSHWSLRAQIQHFEYTGYPDAGPAQFTPVGIGPRYRLFATRTGPFLQAIPSIIVAKWGSSETGVSRVRPGVEIGGGVSIATTLHTAIELSAAYLLSASGGSVENFDAPPTELDGLSQALYRLELSVALGN